MPCSRTSRPHTRALTHYQNRSLSTQLFSTLPNVCCVASCATHSHSLAHSLSPVPVPVPRTPTLFPQNCLLAQCCALLLLSLLLLLLLLFELLLLLLLKSSWVVRVRARTQICSAPQGQRRESPWRLQEVRRPRWVGESGVWPQLQDGNSLGTNCELSSPAGRTPHYVWPSERASE